jgi:RNA:NAD 2'-phosphotransferase (TPT1/KptA family)
MPTKLSGSSWGRTGMRRRWRSSSRCARQPGAPTTPATATQVGARREAPVILTVDAAAMHAAGHAFYQAANGVWLTDHVPPGDLSGWPG